MEIDNSLDTSISNDNNTKMDLPQNKIIKQIVKFCVFVGREKNLVILHRYIELGLQNNIFNEYHMFDFSRNLKDSNFIQSEYIRLSEKFTGSIFIHNYENNLLNIKNNNKSIDKKTNWNPFYKRIYDISSDNDIIIKCDDDILFIDLIGLKNAIIDRKLDKDTFLIHSNCINNGVCAYYHRNSFDKLNEKLNVYPKGGILGVLFENPEIAYGMHMDFLNNFEKLDKYFIDDVFVNSRISINFILINGSDLKYMKDISYHDEYETSSYIPEKLGRVNKIKGDFITSHYSYSFQEKIMFYRNDIYNKYYELSIKKISDSNTGSNSDSKFILETKYKYNKSYINDIYRPILHKMNDNNIFKVKNWITKNSYYIKNYDNNKYLYIDYEKDDVMISDKNRTIFEMVELDSNIFELHLGIYFFTKYNVLGKFKNENILAKNIQDKTERILIKEDLDITNNSIYIKFKKYNSYLSISDRNIDFVDVTLKRQTKWILEKIHSNDEFIVAKRIDTNNKFYYKDVNDQSINTSNDYYTNFYLGWGLENSVW